MVITSQQLPSQMKEMEAYALKSATVTEAALKAGVKTSYYPKFMQVGDKLNGTHFIQFDSETSGGLQRWDEQRPIASMNINEGYSLRGASMHFAASLKVSYIALKASGGQIAAKLPGKLSDAEKITKESMAHLPLIYGHLATSAVDKMMGAPAVKTETGDGLPLFSAAHTWRSNGKITYGNILSNYVHPTMTGVFQINKQISRWRGPNGQPLSARVHMLWLPPELELLANVFQESEKNPLDASNAKNLFSRMVPGGITIDPHMPSTSDWFAFTNIREQWPQMRSMIDSDIMPIGFNSETRTSGVSLVTSFAVANSVHGGLGVVKVTGVPGVVSNSYL